MITPVHMVRRQNPKLFKAEKLTLSVKELERLMAWAFNAGQRSGIVISRKEKSLFEQMFGKL